ncbi:MAG: response regulator, partial [Reyranella sp.]|nr:response regulator [Reyranella sp.]
RTVTLLDKPLSGLRILVVEDELIILMMIEGMLSDLGCSDVVSAPSVDKALALLDGQPFDIALLDMNLGGRDSRSVAEALERHGVPFAIVRATGPTTLQRATSTARCFESPSVPRSWPQPCRALSGRTIRHDGGIAAGKLRGS